MRKFVITSLAAISTLAAAVMGYSYVQYQTVSCYSEKDFFKRIQDDKLTTLVKSESDSEHYIEVMITPYVNKQLVVVEYPKPTSSSEHTDNQYCVKVVGIKSHVNSDIIEELYQALDKLKGTRT